MKRKTNKDFVNEVELLVNKEYIFLEEYIDNATKILVRHSMCGYEYKITPDKFIQGRRCPKCSGKIKNKDTLFFKTEVENLIGKEYTILGEYLNNQSKILIKHESCGNIYSVRPKDFLKGRRCPKCSIEKRQNSNTIDLNTIKTRIYTVVKNEYSVIGNYKNISTPVSIVHNNCTNIYDVRMYNFLKNNNGTRCPKCSVNKNSGYEREIIDYLKTLKQLEIVTNFKLKDSKEIDIYLPEFNVGIEVNGLYWHSEEKGKDKNYHLNKTLTANMEGIKLIQIMEDEWLNKKEIVKSKIKHTLGLNNSTKIYAKHCTVKEINANEKNKFLNENHIQGEDKATIKLGLFHNEMLISVMTFGKERKALGNKNNNNNKYELLRFANQKDISVIGSFGKLFKYFTDHQDYETITTYADLRWSSDLENLYTKNKFMKSHISKPNYWYFYSGSKKREHRFSYRKSELKNKFPKIYLDNKTEREIMKEANFYTIWDCGNIVYKINKK